ncbi:hypothetical protein ABZ552_10295 [Nocardia sp. NPDC019219]|uniref:hypothetical protein n=1 Tax=Nocardia sp. NPDC019219 TaxID=3154590 RepID=UPI00340FEA94
MTDVAPVLRPRPARGRRALGWRDAHLGNVPDTLLSVRPRDSFDVRAARLSTG